MDILLHTQAEIEINKGIQKLFLYLDGSSRNLERQSGYIWGQKETEKDRDSEEERQDVQTDKHSNRKIQRMLMIQIEILEDNFVQFWT